MGAAWTRRDRHLYVDRHLHANPLFCVARQLGQKYLAGLDFGNLRSWRRSRPRQPSHWPGRGVFRTFAGHCDILARRVAVAVPITNGVKACDADPTPWDADRWTCGASSPPSARITYGHILIGSISESVSAKITRISKVWDGDKSLSHGRFGPQTPRLGYVFWCRGLADRRSCFFEHPRAVEPVCEQAPVSVTLPHRSRSLASYAYWAAVASSSSRRHLSASTGLLLVS